MSYNKKVKGEAFFVNPFFKKRWDVSLNIA